MTQLHSAMERLALGMAASDNLAFDHNTEYDQTPYLGYTEFKLAVLDDPHNTDRPEGMSAWWENETLSNVEILARIETGAHEIKGMLGELLATAKEGLVQAAINDNLPQDFSNLDMSLIVDRGFEAQENTRMLDELSDLREIELSANRVLTDKEEARYVELWEILNQREVDVPFGVEI